MCSSKVDSYRIPFKGLKEGDHTFDFEINNSFFENFQESEIKEGYLRAHIVLHKTVRMLTFDFMLKGTVHVPCDRCLEYFDLPITFQETLYVKFGHSRHEESANVLIIPKEDSFLNVSQYLFEYINLALPLRKVHPDDENGNSTCNPLMLKKLEELSTNPEMHNNTDQRWAVLKNVIKNFN